MKIIIILLALFFVTVPSAFAQTSSPSATPKVKVSPTEESMTDNLNKQINDLKDKIASRVAELRLVDKRGIIGIVTDVKDTQIILKDPQEKTRIVDIDEITKFSSPSAKSTFGISDISKGSTISVIGLYNKQSRRILGRFISSTTMPVFISGTVTNVNQTDFTVSVIDENSTTTIVDIEKITKTNSYTKEDEITKSGFSKLIPGDRVVITGYPQQNAKNRITGLRILQLPEAPRDPQVTGAPTRVPSPTPTGTTKSPTPSTRRLSPTPEP